MNDLYLIGNGFDLAHGLKTSYNDFLLWYLKDFLLKSRDMDEYDDKLMKIECSERRHRAQSDFDSVPELLSWLEQNHFKRSTKNDFFEGIIKNYRDYKWVDIEYEYYTVLVDIYKKFEKTGLLRDKNTDKELDLLNNCFDLIKRKLVEYLLTLKINSKLDNRQIESILLEGTGNESQYRGDKLFVNFNYTKTMELYTSRNFPTNGNLINIHGELVNPSNPIIFGYGDEIDPHYEKIENLNRNEFLKYIKSFCYYNTSNYQDTIRFIDSGDYTVKILGHSCGLSDRILLNTIFEHPNCKAIKIYYYKKSETENDFREKTQEISRHFKGLGKAEMRVKIVPLEKSMPLPQNPKDR